MKFSIGMLKPQEEFDLCVRVYVSLSRDKAARDKLFKHYLPLAKKEAMRFRSAIRRAVSADDLFSEACIGLLHAIDKFDPTRCSRLAPVAKMYINDGLRIFLMNNSGVGMNISQSSRSRRIYFGIISYCRKNSIVPPFTPEQRNELCTKFETTEETIMLFEELRNSSKSLETVAEVSCMSLSPEQETHRIMLHEKVVSTIIPFLSEEERALFTAKFLDPQNSFTPEGYARDHHISLNEVRTSMARINRVLKCFAKPKSKIKCDIDRDEIILAA